VFIYFSYFKEIFYIFLRRLEKNIFFWKSNFIY